MALRLLLRSMESRIACAPKLFQHGATITIPFTILIVVYWSALTETYGFSDDYYDIVPGTQGWVFEKRVMEGRPIYAAVMALLTSGGMSIEELVWIRWIGVVGIGLLGFCIFRALALTGCDRFLSFCMAITICVCIPIQITAVWATASLYGFGASLSGMAFALAQQARFGRSFGEKTLLSAAAIFSLFAALAVFQPAAMFFWVFAATEAFKPEASWRKMYRHSAWYGFIFMSGLALGFATYKIGGQLHPDYVGLERGTIGLNLEAKTSYLWDMLPAASCFSFVSPFLFFAGATDSGNYDWLRYDRYIGGTLFLVYCCGLMAWFRGRASERVIKCGLVLLYFLLCFTPNLVLRDGPYAFRVLMAPAAFCVLMAYFSLAGCLRHIPCGRRCMTGALFGAAIATVFVAEYHVRAVFVAPQLKELSVMRFPFEQADLSDIDVVSVIAEQQKNPFTPFPKWEFGTLSSSPDWNRSAMAALVLQSMEMGPNLITLGGEGRELQGRGLSGHIEVHQRAGGTATISNDSFVLDMRNIEARAVLYSWIAEFSVKPSSPTGMGLSTASAIDVYRDNRRLYYYRSRCEPADVSKRFFLHVVPVTVADIPIQRREFGFDNLDFLFETRGVIYKSKCMAVVYLPDYPIAYIRTGQHIPDQGAVWEKRIDFDTALKSR